MKQFTNNLRDPIYKYTLANLNLRSDKSIDSDIINVIPKGSKLEVIDTEHEWLKVIYNSQEGYVYSKFVSKSKYAWTNVHLREDASVTSKSLAIIPTKSRVEVLQEDGDWDKVIYTTK